MKQEIVETQEKQQVETNQNKIKNPNKKKKLRTLNKKENLFIISLIFLAEFLFFSVLWIYLNTGNVTLEQLIFHLKVPLKGTDEGVIWDYIKWTSSRVIILTLIISVLIYIFERRVRLPRIEKKNILYTISKILLVICIIFVFGAMNVFGFAKNQIVVSSLIEEEYVDASTANLIFPEKKQNLIYIYLESMENTFSSIENGGIYVEDRIPELVKIANDNINFSNTNKLGGALNLEGTQWTIAAMVSQTAGIPLKISIDGNEYGKHESFLPGAYTLGEVLEENGYTNYLLLGSESEFGGRKLYFEAHGNYKIWDYNSAIEENKRQESERVWWGYSDNDLFEYAKEQLTKISKNDEPFNYTMLTVDTHFTDGYFCEDCEYEYSDVYSNVIRCSSKKVSDFVKWIKEQPFYENTTIIISGDHLTMQVSTEEQFKKAQGEERSIYNAIINAKVEPVKTTNREFFTFDMYPTTLAALGVQIEGDRLGLGTNLFSSRQTLAEQYGVEYVRKETKKKSTFYNKKLLYGE